VSSVTWGACRMGDLWCDDGALRQAPARRGPTSEEFLALVILLRLGIWRAITASHRVAAQPPVLQVSGCGWTDIEPPEQLSG